MNTLHWNITVSGRVQGVFYRASTLEKALELGIKGIVRNESNGDVYLEAEGSQDQLNQLVNWLQEGPPLAVVVNVEISTSEIKNFTDFQISK